MVSQSSWLLLLLLRNRCQDTKTPSNAGGSLSRNSCGPDTNYVVRYFDAEFTPVGEVSIGCFRAYPENHKGGKATEVESIPLAKIEEFGLHANEYYKLDNAFFKSKSDQDLLERLWTRYWVHTISSSQSLVKNREFMTGCLIDVAGKMDRYKQKGIGRSHGSGKEEYSKVVKEAVKASLETSEAMSLELLRDLIFNQKII